MIYFVQEDRDGGFIKIGYTRGDVNRRIGVMQTGNPARLILLRVMLGTKQDERRLHWQFKSARAIIGGHGRRRITFRGEWFRPVQELLDLIDALPPYPPPSVAVGLRAEPVEIGDPLPQSQA